MTKENDRVNESKKDRQKTIDKLSLKTGRAYTYDTEKGEGSGCLQNARKARKENQKKLDR